MYYTELYVPCCFFCASLDFILCPQLVSMRNSCPCRHTTGFLHCTAFALPDDLLTSLSQTVPYILSQCTQGFTVGTGTGFIAALGYWVSMVPISMQWLMAVASAVSCRLTNAKKMCECEPENEEQSGGWKLGVHTDEIPDKKWQKLLGVTSPPTVHTGPCPFDNVIRERAQRSIHKVNYWQKNTWLSNDWWTK